MTTMNSIATSIVTKPKLIIIPTVVLTIAALIVTILNFSLDADMASFMLSGSTSGIEYAALEKKYTTQDPIQILVSLPDGQAFNDSENIGYLVEFMHTVSEMEGIASVSSFLPTTDPLTNTALDHNQTKVEMWPKQVVKQVTESTIAQLLLSDDQQYTLVMAVPCSTCSGMDVGSEVMATLKTKLPGANITVHLSGNPIIFATVIDMLSLILLAVPPAIIALLLIIFYLNIGNMRLSVLAIVPALIASILTFGGIFAAGSTIDIVTIIVPVFVIVMGSADGLHFVMHFQEEIERTTDRIERVETTLQQVGVPLILTTISTAVGFLSLIFTDVEPIRKMGLFSSIGITLAGIVSFFYLPALLSIINLEKENVRVAANDAAAKNNSKKCNERVGEHITHGLQYVAAQRYWALLISVGAIFFSALTIPNLVVDTDQLFFFKDNHPVRESFKLTQDIFGGATPMIGEFVFDPKSNNITGQLEVFRQLSIQMEELPGIKNIFSFADVISTNVTELQTQKMIETMLDPEEEADTPLGKMVSNDGFRFILFPSAFTDADLKIWRNYADNSEFVRVITGMPIVWAEIGQLVLEAQMQSLVAAFALVFIMLFSTYRKLSLTMMALIPLALTVALVLGFIAASGIMLNLITAIVSSIVIGVGIDYSIHFIAAIDYARQTNSKGYVYKALEKAGRPILANSLGIAVAMSALWISPLKTHGQISLIMWVSMLPSAVLTLLVISALFPSEAFESVVAVVSPSTDVEMAKIRDTCTK